MGLPQGVGGLAILYHFYFISVYFYNTHHVLVGLPQGAFYFIYFFLFVFILVYFYNTHQVPVGLPHVVGCLPILFYF
jgi:hypothetical protein